MLKTRDDKVADHLRVLSADEADAMFDAGGMKPELRARVVDANRWLAEIDRRYHLVALESLEVVRALDMPSHVRSHAVGLGITVDWVVSQLEVVQRHEPGGPGRTVVRTTTPTSWLVPDHPTSCAPSPSNLEMVYSDAARSHRARDRIRRGRPRHMREAAQSDSRRRVVTSMASLD
jgi:hypothetical protein